MTGARHGDDASQRPGAMSTSHLAPVAVSTIVGGKAAFSLGRLGDGKQSSGQEGGSIHGKNLTTAPANKATGQCKAIAAKTCPFKHGAVASWAIVGCLVLAIAFLSAR
jgi:hypothetical protein